MRALCRCTQVQITRAQAQADLDALTAEMNAAIQAMQQELEHEKRKVQVSCTIKCADLTSPPI
jgi:hypothetical protein